MKQISKAKLLIQIFTDNKSCVTSGYRYLNAIPPLNKMHKFQNTNFNKFILQVYHFYKNLKMNITLRRSISERLALYVIALN